MSTPNRDSELRLRRPATHPVIVHEDGRLEWVYEQTKDGDRVRVVWRNDDGSQQSSLALCG